MSKLNPHVTDLNRRRFLSLSAGAALAMVAGPALAAAPATGERNLAFVNLHTGESLNATYWQDGQYVAEELSAINHLLRDYRVGTVGNMEPQLLDLLYVVQQKMELTEPFQVISGYRSPKTNAMLHRTTSGVAKQSRHMLGQAIDVRLPGNGLKHLLQAAKDLRAGGVGYYPKSSFIHLDIGPYRTWVG